MNKKYKNTSGFTLIELLVVMAIIGMIAASTSVVFGNFRKTQTLNIAYDNLNTALAEAKSNAISQVVINCEDDATEALVGYQVSFDTSSHSYSLEEVCDTSNGVNPPRLDKLRTTPLPLDIAYSSTPPPPYVTTPYIRFLVLSGGAENQIDVTVSIENASSGNTKGITVTKSGIIKNAD